MAAPLPNTWPQLGLTRPIFHPRDTELSLAEPDPGHGTRQSGAGGTCRGHLGWLQFRYNTILLLLDKQENDEDIYLKVNIQYNVRIYEYLSGLEGTPVMLEFLFPTKLDFWPLYTF